MNAKERFTKSCPGPALIRNHRFWWPALRSELQTTFLAAPQAPAAASSASPTATGWSPGIRLPESSFFWFNFMPWGDLRNDADQ
ncbi:hypothetical protein M514_28271 [Trichuris suis]|uniref:Uncharacterized protein n=1 Tax=Trichuris suis TaxID=68888 RepID=A0A085MQQ1_9BILA|nr:hypothetical protein M514_28271 [Trichuris suis]